MANGPCEMKERLGFERVGVFDLEGKGIDDTGKASVTEDQEFLENIQNDKAYIQCNGRIGSDAFGSLDAQR